MESVVDQKEVRSGELRQNKARKDSFSNGKEQSTNILCSPTCRSTPTDLDTTTPQYLDYAISMSTYSMPIENP